jgi:TonB family protein
MAKILPRSDSRFAPLVALVGAMLLAVGLFLVIPLTQALQSGSRDTLVYREMVLASPPPPQMPPVPEEQKSYEEEMKPEPPELERQLEDIPVQQLQLSLAPGMGVPLSMGVPSMPQVEKIDTVAEIEKIFNFDELVQPPNVINADMIRTDYPRELTRRGIREAKVVLEVLIDKTGRVRVERIVSISHEHPKLREAARRTAEQARFTVTRVDGRPVVVRGTFPLTLQAP